MANSIAYTKNYTAVLDEVYKRAACSTCLNSPRRMARAGRNAKEIMIPKIEVTGLGDYTRNVGYKTGSITYARNSGQRIEKAPKSTPSTSPTPTPRTCWRACAPRRTRWTRLR